MTVYVVADDFTGANDSIARFTKVDAKLLSLFGTKWPLDAESYHVVALTTNSRGLPSDEAYRLIRKTVLNLPLKSEDILYKKIDSALRGNIGSEIDAVLDGITDAKVALVAPALPDNYRITYGGYQLLNDIPVHETEMAHDPITPVSESHLPTLLAATSHHKVGYLSLDIVSRGAEKVIGFVQRLMADGCRIVAADATRNSHLEILAQVCVSYSSVIVPCGTAGLAGALASRLFSPRKFTQSNDLINDIEDGIIAVVIGSKSRNASLQINQALLEHKWLEEIEVRRIAIAAPETRRDEIRRIIEQIHRATINGKKGIVIRFDSEPIIDEASLNAADLAAGLGETARILAECIKVKTFYLSGGDIAISTVSELGGWGVMIEAEPEPGVCSGRLQGGKFEGVRIITKAGSFGDAGTLARLLRMLYIPGIFTLPRT